jgi:hypothetical protein
MQDLVTAIHSLDDDALLTHFADVVREDRRVTAELLIHIAEIDARKLWAKEGYPSMFAMCVERFLMSEAAAGKRIQAARTATRFPVIVPLIALGELHVSGINRLAPHLTPGNHEYLLGRAKHKTIREIEQLVAELAPRPDVRARVARLPEHLPAAVDLTQPEASPVDSAPSPNLRDRATAGAPAAYALTSPPNAPLDGARVAPLSPGRFKLTATISESTHEKLKKLSDLLPRADLSEILDRALGELLDKTLRRKAALTKQPRLASPRSTGRDIPAAIRRAVWLRDGGRCAYVSSSGRRCNATHDLEYHHKQLYALTGTHDVHTIELRCRAHNQYEAELVLGQAFMERKRRGRARSKPPTRARGDRVSEALARYIRLPAPASTFTRASPAGEQRVTTPGRVARRVPP